MSKETLKKAEGERKFLEDRIAILSGKHNMAVGVMAVIVTVFIVTLLKLAGDMCK